MPVPTNSEPNWWQRLQKALTSRWLITLEVGAILLLVILYTFHQGQKRLASQLQRLDSQIAHLHEHIKGLEGQVQNIQQKQLADLQAQLSALLQRLEAMTEERRRRLAYAPPLPMMTLKDTAGTVVLTEDRQLRMQVSLTSEWRKRVLKLLSEGKLSQPVNVKVTMAKVREKVVVRSRVKETKTIRPISPVKTSVLPDRIFFQWDGVKEATQYRILIADGSGTKILWESQPTSKTSLTLHAHALKLGEVYTWQVEATLGDEKAVSQPALFFVLDKKSVSVVRKMERQFLHSALTLLTVYATYGLQDKAISQINRLQKHNPNHPFIKLLQEAISKRLP